MLEGYKRGQDRRYNPCKQEGYKRGQERRSEKVEGSWHLKYEGALKDVPRREVCEVVPRGVDVHAEQGLLLEHRPFRVHGAGQRLWDAEDPRSVTDSRQSLLQGWSNWCQNHIEGTGALLRSGLKTSSACCGNLPAFKAVNCVKKLKHS